MNKVLKYSFGVAIASFSIFGFVYAAGTITGLGQTINDGDIIGAGWFNEVSSVLGGVKSEGKMCSFASGKISCINDIPTGGGTGSSNWVKNGNDISYSIGNVRIGVGVGSPTSKLEIEGTLKGSAFVDGENSNYYLNPSDMSSLKSTNTENLSLNGTNIYDIFQLKAPGSSAILMNFGEWTGYVDSYTNIEKPVCPSGYVPKLQVTLDWMYTSGNVNDDDLIGTWYIDNGTTWQANGGDYDCGEFVGGRMKRFCGTNEKTKISYTTHCVNESTCGSSSNSTCKSGDVYNVNSCGVTTTLKETCGSGESCSQNGTNASCEALFDECPKLNKYGNWESCK